MYNINKLKKNLPYDIEELNLKLLDYGDIGWYTDVVKQPFFNEFIDNKFINISEDSIRFKLTNLAMAYKLNMKIAGEARLILRIGDEKIGGCTIFEKPDNLIEVGYWILPTYQNKGYAKKLISHIKDLIFKLNKIDKIDLIIREDNLKSIIIAEKSGYTKVSEFKGKYKNNIIYELRCNNE